MFQFAFSGPNIDKSENETELPVGDDSLASKSAVDDSLTPEFIPIAYKIDHLLSNNISRISIEFINIGSNNLPKRPIYDMKYHVMKKDEISQSERILLEETEDVRKNTYEGGLKIWECTLDVINYMSGSDAGIPASILELGAGAGLISAYILQKMLKNNQSGRLVVADYNKSVLELATAPNMLLAWLSVMRPEILEEEIELTNELIQAFNDDLADRGITLDFISGAWSSKFAEVLGSPVDLIVASETIYSPETISKFTDTMLSCFKKPAVGLIAAKKIYFGVGGGILEFQEQLKRRNVRYEQVYNVKEGIGREILKVTASD